MAQMTTPQPPVVQALLAHRCATVFDVGDITPGIPKYPFIYY
jgi:hypothetical protein